MTTPSDCYPSDISQYYAPDYELDVRPSNMDNSNSQEYLQKIKIQVIENLKRTAFNPSVQMTDVPRDPEGMDDEADAELNDADEDDNPDTRWTTRRWEKNVDKDGELSESEDEEENEANGVRKQPGAKKRKNIMDYQNSMAVDDKDMASGAVTARSGRSVNGANGSRRNSGGVGDDSEGDGAAAEAPESTSSTPNRDVEDNDIEMADGGGLAQVEAHSADGPQEATPPASPPAAAASHAAAPTIEGTENGAVDEGDTVDDLEMMKEEGQAEREHEDVAAEQTTEQMTRSEE